MRSSRESFAVRKSTGASLPSARIRDSTCRPSMSGSMMSSTTTSGLNSREIAAGPAGRSTRSSRPSPRSAGPSRAGRSAWTRRRRRARGWSCRPPGAAGFAVWLGALRWRRGSSWSPFPLSRGVSARTMSNLCEVCERGPRGAQRKHSFAIETPKTAVLWSPSAFRHEPDSLRIEPERRRKPMFGTYLRRELVNRRKQTIIIAVGMALAIALVIIVNSVSAGVKHAQASVLQSVYGVGTDITVTQPRDRPGGDRAAGRRRRPALRLRRRRRNATPAPAARSTPRGCSRRAVRPRWTRPRWPPCRRWTTCRRPPRCSR